MGQQKTFEEFINNNSFVIPDYQRAYSWGEKQLNPFINDVLEHCNDDSKSTTYYLGHYILENSKGSTKFEIVDGQQRISTVYLFLLVCGYLNLKEENYINKIDFSPVSYDFEGFEAIKTILSKKENVDIKLEKLLTSDKTMSLARMVKAVQIFIDAFEGKNQKLDILKIDKYIKVIFDAYCSFALFEDKAVASQIFELHNTRGIALSETEKVKSLLMKNIYIKSSTPNTDIEEIQKAFASAFTMEEKASEFWLRGGMSLDAILMYHLRAVEDGLKTDEFNSPQWEAGEYGSFEHVKKKLQSLQKEEIVNYAKNVAREFAKTMEIITDKIPKADKKNPLVGDCLLLDKNRSMIFLLRAFRAGNPTEKKLIERWENFLMCYEMIYWNGYYYESRSYRDNFDSLYKAIDFDSLENCNNLLLEYYNGKQFSGWWAPLKNNTLEKMNEDFNINKWFKNVFGWNKVGYLLYKYDAGKGDGYKIIRQNIFKGDSVSIDHIVARNTEWKDLGFEKLEENKEEADKLWAEISEVINGIGNLALSTVSANSKDNNGLPIKHLDSYKEFGLLKTVEQVKNWNDPKQFSEQIRERANSIREFVLSDIIQIKNVWE